VDVFFGHSVH